MNYGFVIDNRKCIGCHACTVACKSEHDVPIGVNRTWVKYVEKGKFPDSRRFFSVLRCNHCENAPCVDICPTIALHYRENGIVDFDSQRCIACKSCMQACPYDALYIDPDTKTAAKCNFCAHRIELNLEPACVIVCPEEAIISGDLDVPESAISTLISSVAVTVCKPEKGTNPNVFYIDGDRDSLTPSVTEKSDQYLWSEQTGGVGHFAGNSYVSSGIESDLLVQVASESDSGIGTRQQEIVDALRSDDPRRVYDSPDKGILWGWEVAGYIWTKSISAGLFMVLLLGQMLGWITSSHQLMRGSLWITMVFLAATLVLLVKDLDQHSRMLYVLLRPNWKSWLVRGAYILLGFGVVVSLLLIDSYLSIRVDNIPIRLLGVALALMTAVYTAFLLAQAKGRDFWQSPLAPFLMTVHSLLAGIAVLGIIIGQVVPPFNITLAVLLAFNLLLFTIELGTPYKTHDAHNTAEMISRGRYRRLFWTSILFGRVIPMVLILFMPGVVPFWLLAAAILLGIFVTEHIWVRAPQLKRLS